MALLSCRARLAVPGTGDYAEIPWGSRVLKVLRTSLFISLLLQVCLASSIFGAAEGAPLALITIPIALISMVFIDLLGWINPPRLLLNLAALGAVGLAVAEFRLDGESRLLAGGHLIVYLTWTFLLQQKDLRRLWWMFALSILQVAMGAVLTTQPWYGAALFVYTISTIWTMSLLSLARAALLIDPHLLERARPAASPTDDAEPRNWRESYATDSVRMENQGHWFTPRFLMGTVATFVLSLTVGITFFVLIPRIWIGGSNAFAEERSGKSRTGFDESVTLGDTGDILSTNELVLDYVVRDRSGRVLTPDEAANVLGVEPLFRGACLENYDPENKSWRSYDRIRVRSTDADPEIPHELQIHLQPIGTNILFYAGQLRGAHSLRSEEQIYYHFGTDTLTRSEEADGDLLPFRYSVDVLPWNAPGAPEVIEQRKAIYRREMFGARWEPLKICESRNIADLARRLIRQAGLNPLLNDARPAAELLESYLRDQGGFTYTLKQSIKDPTIDPTEDFLFNRKSGHCEYFASALTMLLRGAGIPARMIRGFKGADFNAASERFEVRSLHAHAWVEAFVDGEWITLDATPGARDEIVAEQERPNPLFDQSRSMWFQGMNFSKTEQDRMVYGPLRSFGGWVHGSFGELMEGRMPKLPDFGSGTSPSWLSVQGALVITVLISLLAAVVLLARLGIGRWKLRSRERDLTLRRAVTIEFYARFLKLVRAAGISESASQTPRELAVEVEQALINRQPVPKAQGLAARLTETFYAVRFGEHVLSTEQIEQVDQDLNLLASTMRSGVPR